MLSIKKKCNSTVKKQDENYKDIFEDKNENYYFHNFLTLKNFIVFLFYFKKM